MNREAGQSLQNCTSAVPVREQAKYSVMPWIDTETMQPKYGIQRLFADGSKANCAMGGIPVLFASREVAETYCRLLNCQHG